MADPDRDFVLVEHGADIVRVHDVAAAVRAARMASAVVTDAGSTRRIVRDP
jgi:dihydropteroate synthase